MVASSDDAGYVAGAMITDGPGLVFAFFPLGIVGLLLLLVFVVFIGAARRAGPDPGGHRLLAIYLLAVMFVTLFTATGALFQASSALVRTAVDPLPHRVISYGPGWVAAEAEAGVVVPAGEPEILAGEPPPEQVLTVFPAERRPATEALDALIVGTLAAGVFAFHWRALRRLLDREASSG